MDFYNELVKSSYVCSGLIILRFSENHVFNLIISFKNSISLKADWIKFPIE